jgi:hypothetical protein
LKESGGRRQRRKERMDRRIRANNEERKGKIPSAVCQGYRSLLVAISGCL